jgi:uncharacterized membrane protein AbrB (regulator of aidB expression)
VWADVLTALGALLLVAGVALLSIPAAMMLGGVLLVVAGERASTIRKATK